MVGGIRPVYDIAQHFGKNGKTLRIGPGRIVVADAPQHDTGMVPVTADQVGEIPLMPFGKTGMISFMFGRINIVPCAPFIFGSLPLVKGFVDHEETKRVAERIQLRHMGIVTHTDRIAAHVLQLGKTSVPDSGRYGISGDQRDGDSRLPALRTVTVCMQKSGQVIGEAAVAAGALSEIVAVAPDAAVFVDPVKEDTDMFSGPFFWKGKADTVPAQPLVRRFAQMKTTVILLLKPVSKSYSCCKKRFVG